MAMKGRGISRGEEGTAIGEIREVTIGVSLGEAMNPSDNSPS